MKSTQIFLSACVAVSLSGCATDGGQPGASRESTAVPTPVEEPIGADWQEYCKQVLDVSDARRDAYRLYIIDVPSTFDGRPAGLGILHTELRYQAAAFVANEQQREDFVRTGMMQLPQARQMFEDTERALIKVHADLVALCRRVTTM